MRKKGDATSCDNVIPFNINEKTSEKNQKPLLGLLCLVDTINEDGMYVCIHVKRSLWSNFLLNFL